MTDIVDFLRDVAERGYPPHQFTAQRLLRELGFRMPDDCPECGTPNATDKDGRVDCPYCNQRS